MKRIALIPTAFALVAMAAACADMNAPDASGPLFRHGGDHDCVLLKTGLGR